MWLKNKSCFGGNHSYYYPTTIVNNIGVVAEIPFETNPLISTVHHNGIVPDLYGSHGSVKKKITPNIICNLYNNHAKKSLITHLHGYQNNSKNFSLGLICELIGKKYIYNCLAGENDSLKDIVFNYVIPIIMSRVKNVIYNPMRINNKTYNKLKNKKPFRNTAQSSIKSITDEHDRDDTLEILTKMRYIIPNLHGGKEMNEFRNIVLKHYSVSETNMKLPALGKHICDNGKLSGRYIEETMHILVENKTFKAAYKKIIQYLKDREITKCNIKRVLKWAKDLAKDDFYKTLIGKYTILIQKENSISNKYLDFVTTKGILDIKCYTGDPCTRKNWAQVAWYAYNYPECRYMPIWIYNPLDGYLYCRKYSQINN